MSQQNLSKQNGHPPNPLLNIYIYDYFRKQNYQKSLSAFFADAQFEQPPNPPIDTPNSFLRDWWNIFWDVFSAVSSSSSASQEANAFVDLYNRNRGLQTNHQNPAHLQHLANKNPNMMNKNQMPHNVPNNMNNPQQANNSQQGTPQMHHNAPTPPQQNQPHNPNSVASSPAFSPTQVHARPNHPGEQNQMSPDVNNMGNSNQNMNASSQQQNQQQQGQQSANLNQQKQFGMQQPPFSGPSMQGRDPHANIDEKNMGQSVIMASRPGGMNGVPSHIQKIHFQNAQSAAMQQKQAAVNRGNISSPPMTNSEVNIPGSKPSVLRSRSNSNVTSGSVNANSMPGQVTPQTMMQATPNAISAMPNNPQAHFVNESGMISPNTNQLMPKNWSQLTPQHMQMLRNRQMFSSRMLANQQGMPGVTNPMMNNSPNAAMLASQAGMIQNQMMPEYPFQEIMGQKKVYKQFPPMQQQMFLQQQLQQQQQAQQQANQSGLQSSQPPPQRGNKRKSPSMSNVSMNPMANGMSMMDQQGMMAQMGGQQSPQVMPNQGNLPPGSRPHNIPNMSQHPMGNAPEMDPRQRQMMQQQKFIQMKSQQQQQQNRNQAQQPGPNNSAQRTPQMSNPPQRSNQNVNDNTNQLMGVNMDVNELNIESSRPQTSNVSTTETSNNSNNNEAMNSSAFGVEDLQSLMMGEASLFTEDMEQDINLDDDPHFDSLNLDVFNNYGVMAAESQMNQSSNDVPLLNHAHLSGHANKVVTSSFSSDGVFLASGGLDKKIILWSVLEKRMLKTLDDHTSHITCVRFSPDDRSLLASSSYDKSVRIWNVRSLSNGGPVECISNLLGHSNAVTSVDFSPSPAANICCSIDAEGELKVWNFSSGACDKTINLPTSPSYGGFSTNPVRFHPRSENTVATAYGTNLFIIDISAENSLRTISTPHPKSITHIDWSSDGALLLTASEDLVVVWDFMSSKVITTQQANNKITSCCFLANDGMNSSSAGRIAFGEYEAIYIWNFNGGLLGNSTPIRMNQPQSNMITSLSSVNNPAITGGDGSGILLASGSSAKDSNLKTWIVL